MMYDIYTTTYEIKHVAKTIPFNWITLQKWWK